MRIYIFWTLIHITQAVDWVFMYLHHFDGKSCRHGYATFDTKLPSLISCTTACKLDPECLSVFYNEGAGTCIGCALTSVDPTSLQSMDPGSKYYIETTGWFKMVHGYHRYLLGFQNLPFWYAEEFCVGTNGYLAHIDGNQENADLASTYQLYNATRHGSRVMIGLSKQLDPNTFLWIDDHQPPANHLLALMQTFDEGCVALDTSTYWFVTSCRHNRHAFACEK